MNKGLIISIASAISIYLIAVIIGIGMGKIVLIENKNCTEPINIKDTIFVYKENYDSINKLNEKIDSLNSELFVYKYKLGRIKNYNEIASKGNNIKYLRGWINRVLNDYE